MPDPLPELTALLQGVEYWLFGIGATIFIISVIIAGLLRMPIFGVGERRILISNMALSAAVGGLIIMLLAIPLQLALFRAFPTRPLSPTPVVVPTPTP